MLRLSDDEEAYVSLSMNARGSILPEYSLETMGRLYEQVFEELASERTDNGKHHARSRELATGRGVRRSPSS